MATTPWRVLVADDDADMRNLIATVLRGTDTFTPETIEPFMQKIRAATAPA